MSIVYAILAVGQNGEFGNESACAKGLPFHSPSDLKWFNDFTMGQKLVMSKKTHNLVGDLHGRDIFVETRDGINGPNGMFILHLGMTRFDVILAGGSSLYSRHLEKTDFVFITIIGEVTGQSTINFDTRMYLDNGFDVIYSGSTPAEESRKDVNNLIILRNTNPKRFQGGPHVLPNLIKEKVSQHFHPYLKLKIKNSVTIQPGSHGEVEISTPVHVPVTQTGILSLRKTLARQGLYTSGITFKQGWIGKPTIIVTNNSGSLIELKEGEEIGEISFLNNQCL